MKKNHYSTDIDERSLKTGDVKGESKNGAISEPETYALMAIGAEKGLEEFLGPRADNEQKKLQMYREIAKNGYTTLSAGKLLSFLVVNGLAYARIPKELETSGFFKVENEIYSLV